MPFHRGSSSPPRSGGKAARRAKRSGWKARKGERPRIGGPIGDEIEKPKAKRRPEWQAAREAGAERQSAALAGLEAACTISAAYRIEISVSMIALSRRGKPTVAHVRFLKDARVFAHYFPAAGRLYFGRKGKIADEGRFETAEEAAARVIAYDAETWAADSHVAESASDR